jgi:hypothetical protein
MIEVVTKRSTGQRCHKMNVEGRKERELTWPPPMSGTRMVAMMTVVPSMTR